jgi:hypothetical protein
VGIWIGAVVFTPEVADEIRAKHNVTPAEVSEAVSFGNARRAWWNDHPVYGRRLLALGATYAARVILVVLKPSVSDDGTWESKTAIPWTR